ncbi:Uncharacterized protein OBRU01_07380, partial [Operophtera brumata]
MIKFFGFRGGCVVRCQEGYAYATWSKTKAMKEKKKKSEESSGVAELKPWPEFIQKRIDLWDKYKVEYQETLAAKPDVSIVVTLPDGKTVEAKAWRTSPQGLADSTIIARVNNELWDLDRPLEGDCKLELLRWDNTDAQAVYGGCLCYGPPIDEGFYYDMFYPEKGISSTDFHVLEGLIKKIAKEKQPFERLELTKEQLLEMFGYNQFKVRILNEKVNTATTTVYRCGPLIDLCRGPHVRHTGKVKALKEQELFFFHEMSPGSCFFQPRGTRIYNTLVNFIKEQYRMRGFQEVVTPNMYNAKLWQTSGHWAHYSENMFSFDVEKETFALKPMNCPGHCLMFENRNRSWRELPLRLADFGVLHRNELSGALTGLTRVRRFQQDDAHIFCAPHHIEQEMFLEAVYTTFGFTFQLKLSTRPDKYLGELATWNQAEKIDITIQDALRRSHQCATIQLDFQLPERFNLNYVSESGEKKRPVIIHRAILGSVERMIAILSESYAGKWPFWLSPRQVDTDAGDTLNKKVRNAQLAQFNYILVVGDREKNSGTVNVRTRDNKVHGEMSIAGLIEHLNA